MGWIAEIAGLRAIAALTVVFHHSNWRLVGDLALANTAVFAFFSISGFLAYVVLHRDEQKLGKISYRYFIYRRVLRIWPAYFAIVAGAVAIAHFIYGSVDWNTIIPVLTFTGNIPRAAFEPRPPIGIGITWSVAIEEQFYLLAPVFYRLLNSQRRLLFVIAIVIGANAARILYIFTHLDTPAPADPAGAGLYFWTYTYLDTFIMGMVAGQLIARGYKPGWKVQAAYALSAITIYVALLKPWGMMLYSPYSKLAWLPYTFLPFAGAAMMLAVTPRNSSWLGSALRWKFLTAVGALSYSLYLIHNVVIGAVHAVTPDAGFLKRSLIALPIVVLAPIAVYFVIERPFLSLKDEKPKFPKWAPVVSIALVSIGILFTLSRSLFAAG